MSNFSPRLASLQLDSLISVLRRNDSYIMADVDESRQADFIKDYKDRTGKIVDINHEGIFLRKLEYRVEKDKKQLRLFFNATPEEFAQLIKDGINIQESKGASRLWKRGEFKYILDNTELIYTLIKSGGFSLGPNKNYKDSLHESSEEKDLQNKFYEISEQLQTLDPNSPEYIQLKKDKAGIIDMLNDLEQKRLAPVAKTNFRKKIKAGIVSTGPNLKFDLNRAIENHNTVGKEGFFVLLFNLFMKADTDNYEKLKSVFPQQAMEFEKYKQFGIDPGDSPDSELSLPEKF